MADDDNIDSQYTSPNDGRDWGYHCFNLVNILDTQAANKGISIDWQNDVWLTEMKMWARHDDRHDPDPDRKWRFENTVLDESAFGDYGFEQPETEITAHAFQVDGKVIHNVDARVTKDTDHNIVLTYSATNTNACSFSVPLPMVVEPDAIELYERGLDDFDHVGTGVNQTMEFITETTYEILNEKPADLADYSVQNLIRRFRDEFHCLVDTSSNMVEIVETSLVELNRVRLDDHWKRNAEAARVCVCRGISQNDVVVCIFCDSCVNIVDDLAVDLESMGGDLGFRLLKSVITESRLVKNCILESPLSVRIWVVAIIMASPHFHLCQPDIILPVDAYAFVCSLRVEDIDKIEAVVSPVSAVVWRSVLRVDVIVVGHPPPVAVQWRRRRTDAKDNQALVRRR
jgi:hypothetical protein